MKKISYILLFVIAALFALFMWSWIQYQANGTATKQDLQHTEQALKARIDSILRECDTLKKEIRAVRANTDTLKAGQAAIFQTMQENQQKTSLFEWLWQ